MFDSPTPLQHAAVANDDDETLERCAQAHLASSPHLQVMAELLGKASGTNHGKGGRGHLSDSGAGFFGVQNTMEVEHA